MSQTPSRSTWLGIIVIAIGAALLLDNLDLFEIHLPYWVTSWKMILIVIGLALFASGRRGGIVLVIIGGVFILPDIFNISWHYLRDWWPVFIIILGLLILIRRSGPSTRHGNRDDNSDQIDEVAILGGSTKSFTSQNFSGGKITSMFGGSEINLSGAKLAEGENYIDMFSMFGGSTLIVPDNWDVKIDVISILGGVTDKRKNPNPTDPTRKLILKGSVILGGGEIKSI